MSGPQFAHIQTWSMKANAVGQSITQIIAEATRDPEFSTHVEAPAPPRLIMGDPGTFAADHAAHVAARSTRAKMADGSERVRAIRSDRHTMASIVMSYPVPLAAIQTDADQQKLARWEQRNLEWLRDTYGDQLKVVMAHDDEAQPHLHAWLLPDDPGADATTLHPGKVAKKFAEAEAKAAGLPAREAVKIGNRALKAAMTEWQNVYHEAVGAPEGLTRSGPKRRRLTREQWRAEKETARANAAALGRADEAEAWAVELIDQAKAEADRIMKEAEAKAGRINARAKAVSRAVAALSDEVKAGTLGKEDGKIVAAHSEKIRPGLPEVAPVLHAVADVSQSMKDERAALVAGYAALAEEREEVEVQKGVLKGMIDQLKAGLASVLDFIKGPERTVQEQMEAARLAKRVTPLIGQAVGLIGSGPAQKSGPKAGRLTGGAGGGGLDGPGF